MVDLDFFTFHKFFIGQLVPQRELYMLFMLIVFNALFYVFYSPKTRIRQLLILHLKSCQ